MLYIEFLQEIAERAYRTAYDRGKQPNVPNCIIATHDELNEFWDAQDNGRKCRYDDLKKAEGIKDNAEFVQYYEDKIHNTTWDELADLCIVSATWCYASYLATIQNEEKWDPNRDLDCVLCCGALSFVLSIIQDADVLRMAINLKLRFNELRED